MINKWQLVLIVCLGEKHQNRIVITQLFSQHRAKSTLTEFLLRNLLLVKVFSLIDRILKCKCKRFHKCFQIVAVWTHFFRFSDSARFFSCRLLSSISRAFDYHRLCLNLEALELGNLYDSNFSFQQD